VSSYARDDNLRHLHPVQNVLGQLSPRPMILSLDARSIGGVLD
jgi:hypothetical protein